MHREGPSHSRYSWITHVSRGPRGYEPSGPARERRLPQGDTRVETSRFTSDLARAARRPREAPPYSLPSGAPGEGREPRRRTHHSNRARRATRPPTVVAVQPNISALVSVPESRVGRPRRVVTLGRAGRRVGRTRRRGTTRRAAGRAGATAGTRGELGSPWYVERVDDRTRDDECDEREAGRLRFGPRGGFHPRQHPCGSDPLRTLRPPNLLRRASWVLSPFRPPTEEALRAPALGPSGASRLSPQVKRSEASCSRVRVGGWGHTGRAARRFPPVPRRPPSPLPPAHRPPTPRFDRP